MIYIPKTCGACKGLTKALTMIYDIYETEIQKKCPKSIYIYNERLNEKVRDELQDLGIFLIDNIDDITTGDIVIINTLKVSENIINYLKDNNIEYYDFACPNFKKLSKNVKEKYNSGYEIITLGNNKDFINNWCHNNTIKVLNEQDLIKIDKLKKLKLVIYNAESEKENILIDMIKEKFIDFDITPQSIHCNNYLNVCKSSKDIAKKCDIMFIIGDSSNAKKIYSEVSKHTKAYIYNDINKFLSYILSEDINSYKNIGITGDINTPIKEIYNYKYLLHFILFYKEKLKELKENQTTINNRLKNNSYNENILEVIDDFIDLNQDGKYIRGTLIALGLYLATNKKNKDYLNLAYAYEMFQTSVLIHDDIIDNAKMRRGKETIPRRVCKKYLNVKNNKDYQKDVLALANSLGICAGDLGFYEANQLIVKNYNNHNNFAKILEFFNDIIIRTIKGEMLDVILPFKSKNKLILVEEKDILDIYHLKTSWYTIIGPFTLGYILGNKEVDTKLESILNKIGIIYQIKDDILGIFSEEEVTGKSNVSDIEDFKQTILYSHIIKTAYKNEFLKIYGKKNITAHDLKVIRNLLVKSGSLDYAKDYLDNLYSEIINELDEIDILEEVKDILQGLLIYMNIREK